MPRPKLNRKRLNTTVSAKTLTWLSSQGKPMGYVIDDLVKPLRSNPMKKKEANKLARKIVKDDPKIQVSVN